MYFHERLIELRRQNGWSQETLGNKLNVSRQTVSKWELGQTTPDMNNLREMSAIFNISLDVLVSGQQADRENDRSTPFLRKHFEYKSKARFLNLPLVHINAGRGAYRAKGI
ncbi:MAG: helix-turn-helix transcriptional regulator, partial [Eubacteriales bacterium]